MGKLHEVIEREKFEEIGRSKLYGVSPRQIGASLKFLTYISSYITKSNSSTQLQYEQNSNEE